MFLSSFVMFFIVDCTSYINVMACCWCVSDNSITGKSLSNISACQTIAVSIGKHNSGIWVDPIHNDAILLIQFLQPAEYGWRSETTLKRITNHTYTR